MSIIQYFLALLWIPTGVIQGLIGAVLFKLGLL